MKSATAAAAADKPVTELKNVAVSEVFGNYQAIGFLYR